MLDPAGEKGGRSDREGNKAVVLLNVSLQDVRAGAEHSLKAGPVQFNTLEGAQCSNSGSPGPVHQQGDLTWKRAVIRLHRQTQ